MKISNLAYYTKINMNTQYCEKLFLRIPPLPPELNGRPTDCEPQAFDL